MKKSYLNFCSDEQIRPSEFFSFFSVRGVELLFFNLFHSFQWTIKMFSQHQLFLCTVNILAAIFIFCGFLCVFFALFFFFCFSFSLPPGRFLFVLLFVSVQVCVISFLFLSFLLLVPFHSLFYFLRVCLCKKNSFAFN